MGFQLAVESANFSAVFLRVPAFHFAPFRVNGAIILKWHRVSYLKTGRMVFSRYQVDVTVNRRISMQSFSMSSCVFCFALYMITQSYLFQRISGSRFEEVKK